MALVLRAAAQRRRGLQRLFSAFPGGWPGVGLLLLRVAVGVTAVVQGGAYLSDPGGGSLEARLAGLIVIASGVSLLIGFLTPVAGALMALTTIGIAWSWVPPPASNLFNAPLPAFLVVIIARNCFTRPWSAFHRSPLIRSPRDYHSSFLTHAQIVRA